MTPSPDYSVTDSSFWKRLFNFDEFITSRLIKLIYTVGTILILLATVVGGGLTFLASLFISLRSDSFGGVLTALLFFVISIVGGLLGILLLRVYCEFIMVIFKINENIQTLKDRNERF